MHDLVLQDLRRRLLRWYRRRHRDLPWRSTRDPYRIWISEIMLQQTRVDVVVPYYERFLRRFPNVQALAAAPLDEVLESWSGLGYYSRARNLHAAARHVVSHHGGVLPAEVQELRALPGIGAYTAGAISSIAFGRPAPVLDGNVLRVFARLLAWEKDVERAASRRLFWDLATRFARARQPGDVNQALMELGATLCSPTSPACERCPLRAPCRARALGQPTAFPRTRRRAPLRTAHLAALLLRCGPSLLLVRRRSGRLLRGWWEIPTLRLDTPEGGDVRSRHLFRQRAGFDPGPLRRRNSAEKGKLRHGILSHQIHVELFEARLRHRRRPREESLAPKSQVGATPLANLELHDLEWRWTSSPERQGLPLSTLARKILGAMGLDSAPGEEKPQRRRNQESPQRRGHPAKKNVA